MKDRIRNVMARVLEVSDDAIDENASPKTIKTWDSMHHILLMLALEEEFGVVFADNEVVELTTLELISAAIAAKTA